MAMNATILVQVHVQAQVCMHGVGRRVARPYASAFVYSPAAGALPPSAWAQPDGPDPLGRAVYFRAVPFRAVPFLAVPLLASVPCRPIHAT